MSNSSTVVRQRPAVATDQQGWVLLRNPSFLRIAAQEILGEAKHLRMSDDTVEALKMISIEHPKSSVILKVWVDTEGLDWLVRHKDEQEHRTTALKYCIERQAHYPLIKRLFGLTRIELTDFRKQLNAELPPTKPKSIASSDLDAIYSYWRDLTQSYTDEIDQWVLLALRFQQYPLSSLYTVIYVEATPPAFLSALGRDGLSFGAKQ
jgi:Protein of unknown function (DUF2857)